MEKGQVSWRSMFSQTEEQKTKNKTSFLSRKAGCVLYGSPLCPSLPCFLLVWPPSNPPGRKRILLCPCQTFQANTAFCFRVLSPSQNAETVSINQRKFDGGSGGRFAEKEFTFFQPRQDTFQVASSGIKADMQMLQTPHAFRPPSSDFVPSNVGIKEKKSYPI